MNILLKSAILLDIGNTNLHHKKRDILITHGIIKKIAPKIVAESKTKTVEFKNLHVSAGWFDSSVSFGEPGFEERETIDHGLLTAAKSGFTDIIVNPNTHPVPDSSSDIAFMSSKAKHHITKLYPLGALTIKSEGTHLAELYDMKKSGAVGFYDFKKSLQNPNLLKIALQYAQGFDGLVYSFPMDAKIAGKGIVNEGVMSTKLGLKGIPVLAEELQIMRDLFILEYTGGKLHIPTISTANAVKLISNAKKKGLDVSCSVAIHNLYITDEALEGFDTDFKVMPPLRTKTDAKALIKGLKDGIVDFVTTDHTPIDIEGKRVEFDHASYGTIGLESAFGILNQIFGTEMAICLLTKGRERYGIAPPTIKEGEKACLTLFETEKTYTFNKKHISSSSQNSAFIEKDMKGIVYGVIRGDEILFS